MTDPRSLIVSTSVLGSSPNQIDRLPGREEAARCRRGRWSSIAGLSRQRNNTAASGCPLTVGSHQSTTILSIHHRDKLYNTSNSTLLLIWSKSSKLFCYSLANTPTSLFSSKTTRKNLLDWFFLPIDSISNLAKCLNFRIQPVVTF